MSFTAKADTQVMWTELVQGQRITAICVFVTDERIFGTVYILSAGSITPYIDTRNSNNPVVQCMRKDEEEK